MRVNNKSAQFHLIVSYLMADKFIVSINPPKKNVNIDMFC